MVLARKSEQDELPVYISAELHGSIWTAPAEPCNHRLIKSAHARHAAIYLLLPVFLGKLSPNQRIAAVGCLRHL